MPKRSAKAAAVAEKAGALRDMIQNHVFQVIMIAEPPASLSANGVRDEKIKAMQSACVPG
jgi:glucose-6-phosphate 1-dehydrogenase